MNAAPKPDMIDLEILETKATVGYWKAMVVISDEPTNAVVMCGQDRLASGLSLHNARVIAAAHNALPWMIKRIGDTESFEDKLGDLEELKDVESDNTSLTADNEVLSKKLDKAVKNLKAITKDNPMVTGETMIALRSIISDLEASQ